jgi:beta-glucanase (GH16 family)
MKRKLLFAMVLLGSLTLAACADKNTDGESTMIEDVKDTGTETALAVTEVPEIEGYELFWHDEFDGDRLDTKTWTVEAHKPGWVNHELQEYVIKRDNIFLRDGKLVIKAIKTVDDSGNVHYTSGRMNTNYAMSFTYGKVVVGAKVPKGKGLWPAAWMMPSSNEIYGQWPLGGEIDIMEILGHDTKTTYSTIHYGLPHEEQQGRLTVTGDEPDFAEAFHEFSVEWEPGEIRFYVDNRQIATINKWFTKNHGQVPAEFPAPFDKPFHVILNLAVGGDWPGSPDDSTDFDNAEYLVDYVRVYTKTEQ